MKLRSPAPRLRRIVGSCLLFLLVVALAGCSRQPDGVPAVQGEGTPAAPAPKASQPANFDVADVRVERWQGQLAIVLEFSRPLVGTQAFDTLITVSNEEQAAVEGSWALDDENARLLRFPYVKANSDYTLQIRPGLSATDGSTLEQPIERKLHSGPLEPSVGFASQGSVLPARETRGLPVVSINVKEVDVQFLRVRDAEVANFFAAYQRNGQRSGWDLDPQWGWYGREGKPLMQIAESVYANRFALVGKENERSLNYLPIQNIGELAQPGLYFASMQRAGSFSDEYQTCFFFVSDIGLHSRSYKDTLFVHAASLRSGIPLAGVDLAVLDAKGETVASGRSDAEGNAQLAYAFKSSEVLVARSGKDVSLLPFNQPALDLSDFAVGGRRQAWFDVFAWSGRDLYRPGETVRLSALLRNYDGKPIKPQPLFLTLKQPDGRIYSEARLEPREGNYFEWSREIPADAPTGRWNVEFRTDPNSEQVSQGYSLRIEDFLPERMKLDLSSPQAQLSPGEELALEVQGDYLYGAPAAGSRFSARLTLAPDQHPVASRPDFFFGDPALELPKQAEDALDAKLDAQGHLSATISLGEATQARGPVVAIVAGSLYESGGRPVSRTLKRSLWPADVLVGLRPLFDPADGADANARAGFEMLRSGADGVALPGTVRMTLMRDRREYHWVHDEESGWHFEYRANWEEVEKRDFALTAENPLKFDVPLEWGNYRIDVSDPATGLVMRFPFYAGWSWDDDNRGSEARPDKVKLALDKEAYRAGETLEVTVTAPQAGPGLLLVESDHLLYAKNIDARPGASFRIPVTKDWERHDVYLTALVFRGGSAVEKITPARAVGEVHIPIDRSEREVAVEIEAPPQMKPEQDLAVTIKVPALAGDTAWITLSAVDLGILNITRFEAPDPNAWWFAPRAFGIDAYDLYGRVIESFDGSSARLRYGGDMALEALPQARRPTARVLTVDLFSGAVALDAKGEAQVSLHVPDFNGTLRISAVAYSTDRYGSAAVETVVRAPLVAEASMPRVLAPGDESKLTLDLQNFSGVEQELTIDLRAESPLAIRDGHRTLRLADQAKATLDFPLAALDGYGVGRVQLRARGADLHIDRDFETVVRAAWPGVLHSEVASLEQLAPISLGADALNGLFADSARARLTVSSLPPLPFQSALRGLLDYPYGCVEQTASKGYAALTLDQQTSTRLGVPGLSPEARQTRMTGAIGRIASMQVGSGHFSMWGGDSYVNTFLTPYITGFLLDAREAGFLVPDGVLQKALQRLSDDLLSGGHPYYNYAYSDHLRFADEAWSGFVLARVQRAPLGTLRALFDNERNKSLTALPLVHLGIALKLMGDQPRAESAVAEAFARSRERPAYLGDYGSELRDEAQMVALVETYGLSKPAYRSQVFDLARRLSARQGANGQRLYLSTQEQSALAALGKVLIEDADVVVAGSLSVGGKTSDISPDRMWSREFDAAELRQGVRFQPRGDLPLYVSKDLAGVPRAAPPVDEHWVSIQRRFYTLDGKPWTPAPLSEGDALIVGLRLEAREAMPDALLVDLLPGGFEIENFNLTDAKQWADVAIEGISLSERGQAADVRHEEFRDDRYVASLDLGRGQTAQLFYLVRAVSPGSFRVPPPQVEDMYRPEIRGVGASQPASIQVIEPRSH